MNDYIETAIKTVVYRALCLTTGALIGWYLTGSLVMGVQVSLTYNMGAMIIYFVYERSWRYLTGRTAPTAKVSSRECASSARDGKN